MNFYRPVIEYLVIKSNTMIKIRKLFFMIFIAITHFAIAQAIYLPGEEAPKSIFSISPGGTDVDLFLLGSWETEIRGGFGFSWNSENPDLQKSSFPGMVSGLKLNHSPDIFISLWLLNSYFFETSFIDDYDLNTILFGYEAVDENFVQSVRIGNTDIGFGEYSYLTIPAASADSMGGMALFKNDKSEHQLMIRYDPAEMQVKNYIGKYEVDNTRIRLTDYIKGRYFVLPDENVENLKVYIEDSSGTYYDGNHLYRLAGSNDAIISAEEGLVFFRDSLTVRAAVNYTKNGGLLTVGDGSLGIGSLAKDSDGLGSGSTGYLDISATDQFQFGTSHEYLGIDMDTWSLTIDSKTALLLYEPGVFSPFEMLSVYSLSYLIPNNPALFKANLTDINLSLGESLDISTTFEDYMVRILYNNDSFRDPANRYPLADRIDTDALIYEESKNLSGSPADKELLFQRLFPAGNYYLGDNVLEGSVSVTFNGFEEYRYNFNPDTGNVKFLFPVPSDANIEIKYRTMITSGKSGDVLVALGSKFNFSDNFILTTGLGLRWNILDSSYIEQPGDASGSILGTAGFSYKGKNIDFKIDAGVSIFSPNTTGILRIAGMNNNGFNVPVSANMLYPSSASESGITTGVRGKLFYKDYHEYNSAGTSVLRDYSWSLPSDQSYNYADGGRTGPYITATGSEIKGNAAVIDYNLGSSEWTGGRIPMTLGTEPLDLSSMQSISLKWKHIDTTGSTKIYIRIGKLAEDLDNDGVLDKETSIYESGFNFNDGLFNMKVGLSPDSKSGNEQLDTEDSDGNSILDGEGTNLILTLEDSRSDFTEPGLEWKTLNLKLSPADREKLQAVTGFEIIIVEDSLSTAAGRLLVGDIIFSGSSFVTKPDTGQLVTAEEVNELYSVAPAPLLTENYPEAGIFSTGEGPQNIAEITWKATDDTWNTENGTWKATTFTEAVDLWDYNKISFFMKTPDISEIPTDMTFSFTNPSGEGISLSFPLNVSTDWIKYTIDYGKGTLTAKGENIAGIIWKKRDINSSNTNRLSFSAFCTSEGSLLIDEVHMEDPVVGISAAASTNFNYRYPGTILSIGKTAVVSNFAFNNSSSIKGPNFASGFTDNRDSSIYTASSVNISLLAMRITGNLNLQWQETELFSSPGISFSIPFFNNLLKIEDSYSEVNLPLSSSVRKESSLTTKMGSTSIMLSADSSHSVKNMIRNWGIGASITGVKGSTLASSAYFRMTSIEDPYEGLNSLNKFIISYEQYLPGNKQNDRNSTLSITPTYKLNNATIGLEEILESNTSGSDKREIRSTQVLSLFGNFNFNSESLIKWNFIPKYKKTMSITDNTNSNTNFFLDISESVQNIGTQNYYVTGFPIWEIFFPNFASQFNKYTKGQIEAEYIPEFSLGFSRLTGSRPMDIFIPTEWDINFSRHLNRDFDSMTDSLKIKFETRATALNVFGNLGTTPLISWYQTEEITNIIAIGGEYRSYGTELLNDPVFNINYSLYLNLSLSKKNSIDFQSSHNWELNPLIWNSTSSGSYIWQVIPKKIMAIPLLYDKNEETKPYFEHKEKLTLSTISNIDIKENSFTITINHATDLIFTDKGNISLFAGIGIDKKSITNSNTTISYYLLGFEAGISARLTF